MVMLVLVNYVKQRDVSKVEKTKTFGGRKKRKRLKINFFLNENQHTDASTLAQTKLPCLASSSGKMPVYSMGKIAVSRSSQNEENPTADTL